MGDRWGGEVKDGRIPLHGTGGAERYMYIAKGSTLDVRIFRAFLLRYYQKHTRISALLLRFLC